MRSPQYLSTQAMPRDESQELIGFPRYPVSTSVSYGACMQQVRRRVTSRLTGWLLPPDDNLLKRGCLPRAGIQRILVSRPNHRLGNTVMITSLMSELEKQFPGAEIDVLSAGEAARDIFRGFTSLGGLHLLDRRAVRHPIATVMTLGKLRSKRYDLVIDAAANSSSGKMVARWVNARYQLRIEAIAEELPLHFAERPVRALRLALDRDFNAPLPPLDMRLNETELEAGRTALRRVIGMTTDNDLPVLVVFPNATGTKRYNEDWWDSFLTALFQSMGPYRVIELIAADGLSRLGDRHPTYFTSDTRRLAAFIDAAGLYISADCGVMHLAAATRATTIGLFCKTDPERYAPYGGKNLGLTTGDIWPQQAAQQVATHLASSMKVGEGA